MRENRLEDEAGRLAALNRYEIVDTGEERPLQRVVELVRTILGVPIAAVTFIDADRQWLKASVGTDTRSLPREISFCRETIKQSGALAVTDARSDRRFADNPIVTGDPNVRSYLGVPLTSPDGYNIGSLCAFDTEARPFDAREASILKDLSEIVVEQLELRQIAKHDSLTGALTRRGFFAELEKEFLRATRYERNSSLVLIDVDHFKTVNDRYGHPAGDAVLTAIGNACLATMRKSDVFGRVGGEEFALLLPETDADQAHDAAERLRSLIERTIVDARAASIQVTISLGIAQVPTVEEGIATWFAEADLALYEAKHLGRNRVVFAKPRHLSLAVPTLDLQASHLN